MREILFRGKRVDNGEWVYGFLDKIPDHMGFNMTVSPWWIHVPPKDPEDVIHTYSVVWYDQFTGLTDKNGKKIFEGDIGRYKQTDGAKRNGNLIICVGKVVYNTKNASYAVESKDETGCKYFDYFPIRDFEVIGNIHDNPELLKEDTYEENSDTV